MAARRRAQPATPVTTITPVDPARWTVMVFMGADTIEGTAPLTEPAAADVLEMSAVGSGGGLDIFVQVHGIGGPKRGRITEKTTIGSLRSVPRDQRGIADGHALEHFVQWSLREGGHDPGNPNHFSMLVLWGHAYEFAIGRERTRQGTVDALDFAGLSDTLRRLQQQRSPAGSAMLDVVGFDACDLSTVEMACQLQPFARYLLGSQIGIPIPGWPYDRVLDRLRRPRGRVMRPAELGSYIVRRFCESYPASSPVSLTLLDLERGVELLVRTQILADVLLTGTSSDAEARERVAELFRRSQTIEGRPYVDVVDLCLNLVRESDEAFIIEAARALGDFLLSPNPPLVGQSADGGGRPFLVEHGRNAGRAARLNGVGIYAPHVAPSTAVEASRHIYESFAFSRETCWSELVHAFARPT